MGKLTGGLTNYYLVPVLHPQRKEQEPYQAECEDIAEALQLTPNEFCEFKAIWRTAAARLGNGKPDHKALYDAEKRVHYAQRDVAKYQRELNVDVVPEPADPIESAKEEIAQVSGGWVAHTGDTCPMDVNALVQVRLDNGHEVLVVKKAGEWNWCNTSLQQNNLRFIDAWRFA